MTEVTSDGGGIVVGHKTFSDGQGGFRHEPLTRAEADAICAAADEAERKRAEDMPTEQDAVRAMFRAWYRLKELGWKEAQYAPAGMKATVIEIGSSGMHDAYTDDERHWWLPDEGDLWPSRPCLYKPKESV